MLCLKTVEKEHIFFHLRSYSYEITVTFTFLRGRIINFVCSRMLAKNKKYQILLNYCHFIKQYIISQPLYNY